MSKTIRVCLLAYACALSARAYAQHGPGGPGGGTPGGGGGFGHGGMGGGMNNVPRNGSERNNGGPGISPTSIHTGPQLGPTGRWWDDKKTAKAVNLTAVQQTKMDTIFNANKGQLLNLYNNLQREESRLSSMSREDLQDETKVFAAIDRVAAAKAELEKANARILMQIRKEMDGGQLAALEKVMQ